MLVSVIVPNYNYARTLDLCLAAVNAQTYPDVEVIVVDDNSTDDSVRIAEARGARVIRTGTNIGAPAARNLGATEAEGEVLFFLDSDVALRPDALAEAVAILADPAVGAACGTYEAKPLIRDSLVEEYRALQLYSWWIGDLGDTSTVFTAIMAIRADVFAEVGGFNPALRHSENADYGHRLSQRYRILLTDRIQGRHDHDDKLGVLLTKFFHRARLHVPLFLTRPDFSGGPTNGSRGWGSVAALLAAVSLLAPAVLGVAWLALPALLFATFVLADLPMYRIVRGHVGPLFLAYYTAVHFVVNVTVGLAVVAGLAQCAVSQRFRTTYALKVA
ncbi:glycosyltransferase family 2 protein [Actinoplanes sp. NEAU-A12]|uniref:Glycosyltransferase family 2 protein n=1 Tax=Actinoplanes sandaracinus TaxID=3045177 RepID=A0ABT6WI37_9ACTN|nr:glycosyltransferase family 2 protein [Actinoplanes sandaracinus]MDI6099384.1 glycosyltransferase family 2 protein [Actinoplanes sandaracinus]